MTATRTSAQRPKVTPFGRGRLALSAESAAGDFQLVDDMNIEVLDEWGYPIIRHEAVEAEAAALAVKLCPARALYLR